MLKSTTLLKNRSFKPVEAFSLMSIVFTLHGDVHLVLNVFTKTSLEQPPSVFAGIQRQRKSETQVPQTQILVNTIILRRNLYNMYFLKYFLNHMIRKKVMSISLFFLRIPTFLKGFCPSGEE